MSLIKIESKLIIQRTVSSNKVRCNHTGPSPNQVPNTHPSLSAVVCTGVVSMAAGGCFVSCVLLVFSASFVTTCVAALFILVEEQGLPEKNLSLSLLYLKTRTFSMQYNNKVLTMKFKKEEI